MNELIEKKFKSAGIIKIKPYVDKNVKNMGLEEYNMVVFPGTIKKKVWLVLNKTDKFVI